MRTHAVAIFALALLAAAVETGQPPQEDDTARIQGTWRFASMQVEGENKPEAHFGRYTSTLQGDLWTVRVREKIVAQSRFQLDPATTPKTIDLTSTISPTKGRLVRGIYTLEGDTLKMCDRGIEKGDRPTEFTTRPNSGLVLVVLKRVGP